jgi:outer membrane protein assembly factor BamB
MVFVTDFATDGARANDPGTRSDLAGRERVLALDFATGKVVWSHDYPVTYRISYPAGPRATPTVQGGKVYVLGAEGHLTCLESRTGKVVWSRNLAVEYKAETPIWGYSAHPLIDGQKLITLAGGSGSIAVALDKDTGKELWRALDAPSLGYCPPSIIEAGGRRQLLIWHPQALNSLDPETGKLFWSEKLEPQYGMFAGGIGNKAVALRLASDKPAATELWRGTNQTAVYPTCAAPMVDDQGVLYGACQQGHFRAVELKTGKRLWETFKPTTGTRFGSSGTCFVVRNADRWFLMSETGELIIARLTADRYEELDRARILAPTNEAFGRPVVWSHPAFADRRMVARNDQEIVCVSLAE